MTSVGGLLRNLRLLLALLLLAFGTLACQPRVSASEPVEIGMNIHPHPADAPRLKLKFDLMAAMHVKWVRMVVDWSAVEPERGKPNWTYVDEIVEAAAAQGIELLGLIAFTPAWAATPAAGQSANPSHARASDTSAFANFARSAADRYAPRGVHTWEIWNEPNIDQFWPPRPDADEYGGLFRVAAEAIRGVDSRATLLIGGLAQQPDAPNFGVTPTAYLEQLYRNGSAQLADGVAAHPYSYPSLPMDPNGQSAGGFMDLPKLHDVMESHGDGAKKIWLTEFGAPTGTAPNAVSEAKQAEILLQARRQVDSWDWAGPLFYYELVDHGMGFYDKEENFGVLRADLTPKLAALALMANQA